MANILLNNICNLRCPYCFSDTTRDKEKMVMTPELLNEIFRWIGHTPHLGLIGGEPTLNPYFDTLLGMSIDFVNSNFLSSLLDTGIPTATTVFTNGIELSKWEEKSPEIIFSDTVKYLINYNQLPQDKVEQIDKSITGFYEVDAMPNISLGCNLYLHNDLEYNWYWDVVDKYEMQNIRVSIVSPANLFADWRGDRFAYFEAMKPHALRFAQKMLDRHLRVGEMDCGYIPRCMFTEEEIELLDRVGISNSFTRLCTPVIDIDANKTCISCFGSCSDRHSIYEFDNLKEAEYYFAQIHNHKQVITINNNHCAGCEYGLTGKCQAGCLCFAKE